MAYAAVPVLPDAFRELVTEIYEDIAELDPHAFQVILNHLPTRTGSGKPVYADFVFQSTEERTDEEMFEDFTRLLRAREITYVVEHPSLRRSRFEVTLPIEQFEDRETLTEENFVLEIEAAIERAGSMSPEQVDEFIKHHDPFVEMNRDILLTELSRKNSSVVYDYKTTLWYTLKGFLSRQEIRDLEGIQQGVLPPEHRLEGLHDRSLVDAEQRLTNLGSNALYFALYS
jgi:hypothetical protein